MRRSTISIMLGFALATAIAPAAGADPGTVLATLDGQPITEAHADEAAPQAMHRARTQYYEGQRAAVDEVIARRLVEREAKRRGVSIDELLRAEIDGKMSPVTDAEIRDFYDKNRARIRGSFDDAKGQIAQHLQQQQAATQTHRLLFELRLASRIAYLITAPRVEVAATGPAKGVATAPVTIVEFSDFECVFCRRSQSMLKSLLESYGPSVRLVYRDFPTDNHKAAKVAAEAARCADDQGKFWEYHDLLFANQSRLGVEELKGYARQISLDEQAFATCLASRKYQAVIERDIEDGRKASVQGTPTFFINGRPVVGAQPIETFRAVIDEEIARSKQAASK